MKFSAIFCALLFFALAVSAYDRNAAVAYAKKWWNGANHNMNTAYTSCSPYSWWDQHGGDCANFVSQCLVAGGHKYLNQGGSCRGYPCGKEEIGAKNLGDCLHGTHGWTRTCGYHQAPPPGIKPGDVLIYHSGSCSSYDAHATIVVSGGSTPTIACHSNPHYGVAYTYMAGSKPYYEWLQKN